jgi:GTPase involved in cell partitioning and DNA repair
MDCFNASISISILRLRTTSIILSNTITLTPNWENHGAFNQGNHRKTFAKIALIGNPNAGKTTLFNLLTGAKQRTGNWPQA